MGMTTNSIKNTKKEKKSNTTSVKNKSKNKKNKRKNKEEDDFEADLQDICLPYRERAKKRLREGKPINPLWHCYERHIARYLFGKEWTSDYY